jgi:hypothetical protein
VCLPNFDGGFGLGFVTHTSYSAFCASCVSSFHFIRESFPQSIKRDMNMIASKQNFDYISWVSIFENTINRLNELGGIENSQPFNIYDLINIAKEPDKIQSQLTIEIERHKISHFEQLRGFSNNPARNNGRVRSAGGKHAGAWLRAIGSGDFVMSPSDFQSACLLRLGMPIPGLSDTLRCNLCKDHPLIGVCGEHFTRARAIICVQVDIIIWHMLLVICVVVLVYVILLNHYIVFPTIYTTMVPILVTTRTYD